MPMSGGSVSSNMMETVYAIYKNGSNYKAQSRNGSALPVYEGAVAHTVINNAYVAANGYGGGKIFARGATDFDLTGSILPKENVAIEGENKTSVFRAAGNDVIVFDIASGENHVWIDNLKITKYGAVTGTVGIRDAGGYTKLRHDWITDIATGIETQKPGTGDRWYEGLYILNFASRGWLITKSEDHLVNDINIGTQTAGAEACIDFLEGGAGFHGNNIHLWASASCNYGLHWGTAAGTYAYDAEFTNLEVEDSGLLTGIYCDVRGNKLDVTGLKMKAISAGIGIDVNGLDNKFVGSTLQNCGNSASSYPSIRCQKAASIHDLEVFSAPHHGLEITSAYSEMREMILDGALFKNGATGKYDVHVYHTKRALLTGIKCIGSNVTNSIAIVDSDHTTLLNSRLEDKAYMTSGTTTNVQIHLVYNAGTWVA